jgi:hypothetical protein
MASAGASCEALLTKMDLDGSESDETKKGQVGFFVTDGVSVIM